MPDVYSDVLFSTSRSSILSQEPTKEGTSSTNNTPRFSRHSGMAAEHHAGHRSAGRKRRAHKRIIVLCDGTWEDGVKQRNRSKYTNVLRLARSIHHEDARREGEPHIPQVVFYQSGIGSGNNFYSEYIEGTTGSSLPDKVEEAYAYIAHNFVPGDEIFLFGFSRGAYTARMVAMFIGAIGILTRKDMDHFGSIFMNFQKLGLCKKKDAQKKADLEALLAPWRNPQSEGHKRSAFGKDKFTVKCVGVWDTVGAFGLPHEIDPLHKDRHELFSFPDCHLGEHIETAYQALAINEMRKDFVCNKFIQSSLGRAKGQILKQTWFTGCHADIGGGYPVHDLSDLTLIWMAANIEDKLLIDIDYLRHLIDPVAPWGVQIPHDSRTGIFALSHSIQRTLPSAPNIQTQETVHASVFQQMTHGSTAALDALAEALATYPTLRAETLPLEQLFYATWPYDPHTPAALAYEASPKRVLLEAGVGSPVAPKAPAQGSWFGSLVRSVSVSSKSTRGDASDVATVVEEVEVRWKPQRVGVQ